MIAKKAGTISPDQILALARNFYQSVRAHSQLNKRWQQSVDSASGKLAKDQCHTNFWTFSKQLLDNKSSSGVEPVFTKDETTDFFNTVYHAEPHTFHQPAWMPSPSPPVTDFNCDGITLEEITLAIRNSRSNSSPCPFDGIFKQCPALLPALQDLFNSC